MRKPCEHTGVARVLVVSHELGRLLVCVCVHKQINKKTKKKNTTVLVLIRVILLQKQQ